MPDLALIVVTHNSGAWLPTLMKTWRETIAHTNMSCEILIADSGSTDDTLAIAAGWVPEARILEYGHVGFGAAVNRAAAATVAPWILLCNPDIDFEPDFASTFLLAAMTNPPPSAGCIAPKILDFDGVAQPSTGPFPSITQLLRDQFRLLSKRKYYLVSEQGFLDWATGACLLVRREHFNLVHGFDEKFFLYVEEVDLQRRLAHHGLKTFFLPTSAITHHASAAIRPLDILLRRYAARGLLRYFAKHGSILQFLAYRLLATISLRLPPSEAFASKQKILNTPTGP